MEPLRDLEQALMYQSSRLKIIDLKFFDLPNYTLDFYLDYLNHDLFSGNKLRKLYGTILQLQQLDRPNILTIGGNYSNHLYACANLKRYLNMDVVAIIKGHQPKTFGYTLNHLVENDIPLYFYSKEDIRHHLINIIDNIRKEYPNIYYLPEGGTGEFSHLGFESLIKNNFDEYTMIALPVGSLGTYSGVERYKSPNTNIIGYAAHNDVSLADGCHINFNYHFGGFAKMTTELMEFIEKFYHCYQIILDPIYTCKMIYGIIQDLRKGIYSSSERIVAIHTGGLQGWHGMRIKPSFIHEI